MRINPKESAIEIALVKYAWIKHKVEFVHVPNELMRFLNKGQKIHYMKMGCKPQFPDLVLFEPRGKYHGLVFELKSIGKEATEEQQNWLDKLTAKGYYAQTLDNLDLAMKTLDDYLKLP